MDAFLRLTHDAIIEIAEHYHLPRANLNIITILGLSNCNDIFSYTETYLFFTLCKRRYYYDPEASLIASQFFLYTETYRFFSLCKPRYYYDIEASLTAMRFFFFTETYQFFILGKPTYYYDLGTPLPASTFLHIQIPIYCLLCANLDIITILGLP